MSGGGSVPGPWSAPESALLEIVQMRDLTLREAARVSSAATRSMTRMTPGDPIYWVLMIGMIFCIALVAYAFSHFAYLARCAGIRFPVWAELAFFAAIGLIFAMPVRAARAVALLNRQKHRAGNRYMIADAGLSIDMQGMVTQLPWRCMLSVSDSPPHLYIYLNAAQLIAITKAAFEGQDARAFSAELMRRWQQHRAPSIPGASS